MHRFRFLRLPGVAKMGRGSGDKQARGEPFPLKLSVEGRSGVGLHGTRRQRRGPAPSLCFGLHDCHGSEIFIFKLKVPGSGNHNFYDISYYLPPRTVHPKHAASPYKSPLVLGFISCFMKFCLGIFPYEKAKHINFPCY